MFPNLSFCRKRSKIILVTDRNWTSQQSTKLKMYLCPPENKKDLLAATTFFFPDFWAANISGVIVNTAVVASFPHGMNKVIK